MIEPEQENPLVPDISNAGVETHERPPKPNLRAATALIVLLLFFVGQLLFAFAVMIYIGFKFFLGGGDVQDQAAIHELVASAMPQIAIVSTIGGALGLALGARLVKKSLFDASRFGAAWKKGRPKALLVSVLLGAGAACAYFMIPMLMLPAAPDAEAGPLAQMATRSGFGQYVWMVIALFIAPFIEELLFRGILLGGLNRSFGLWWGAFLANFFFVAIHFSEAVHYWPAFLGIGFLAIVATRQRLVEQAIGPAMAAHFGYNLVVVAVSFYTSAQTLGA